MSNSGWVKLYRKIIDNDIIKDEKALQIFIWLLLKVDIKTGKKTIGRFWASDELGIKPSTFYKALKRLEEKYKIVTRISNNKSTEIRLINWYKYQHTITKVAGVSNNKVTTKEQQSNTLQEYKNIRSKEEKVITPPKKYSSLKDITPEVVTEISTAYKVPESFVNYQLECLINYCQSKGKTYKNYRAALNTFVIKSAKEQIERGRKNDRYGYTKVS